MRIVLAGGFAAADSLGSISRAFRCLGHDVRDIWTRKIFREGGSYQTVAGALLDGAKDWADALLWWNAREDIQIGLITALREKVKIPYCYWTVDDPHFLISENPLWLNEFDFFLTCCEESKGEYERRGKIAEVFYPPVDPDFHRYMPQPKYEASFCLAMTNCYTKQDYPEILFDRRELARRLQQELGGVALYGFWDRGWGWGSQWGCPELKECFRGWINQDDIAPAYSSAKITVNSHVRTQHSGYLNARVFEALGCRSFLLVDRVKGIEEIFEDGVHCVFYDSLDDLVEKARYYLAHEIERKRIAYQGSVYAHWRFNAFEWVREFEELVNCNR